MNIPGSLFVNSRAGTKVQTMFGARCRFSGSITIAFTGWNLLQANTSHGKDSCMEVNLVLGRQAYGDSTNYTQLLGNISTGSL